MCDLASSQSKPCWINPMLHVMPNASTFWTHIRQNAPTLLTHIRQKCTKVDSSLMIPRILWQIGVEQIQTPLQIPHLMGNLERCLDLLYSWGIWRDVWICSTPICHKASGLYNDRLPLVQCGIICVQKVCASGILCIQQVGVIWREMQQRVNALT